MLAIFEMDSPTLLTSLMKPAPLMAAVSLALGSCEGERKREEEGGRGRKREEEGGRGREGGGERVLGVGKSEFTKKKTRPRLLQPVLKPIHTISVPHLYIMDVQSHLERR